MPKLRPGLTLPGSGGSVPSVTEQMGESRPVDLQGGPAKVRPTYIFDGNI